MRGLLLLLLIDKIAYFMFSENNGIEDEPISFYINKNFRKSKLKEIFYQNFFLNLFIKFINPRKP